MTVELQAQAAAIAREAMELPFDRRDAYLEEACSGNLELRAYVDTLTGETEYDDATYTSETEPSVQDSDLPLQVGPYRLLKRIGEGGFGEVFLAEQTSPVRRKVAFKVLQAERNTDGILRRFESERQLLAKMDHPGIAHIFDAGETPGGRPFFAMEMVEGRPIADHCDANGLGIRERMALAARMCRAVHHAHQKGIIHRDIKSSNVLVAMVDGQAIPKVIDFGIAKATDESLSESAERTREGEMIGTPAFMSPEQIAAGDIDIRTDVYSLGVLIYQLLTGTLPFTPDGLRSSGLIEFHRRVLQDDAPRPSERLTKIQHEARLIAKVRGTHVAQLIRQVTGELDWIALKALEKDPERRYDSAADLADDLERYLADRPVTAHPPTAGYSLAKFARRNKVLVGGVLATAVALVAGIVATATFAYREAEQRKFVENARSDLEAVVEFQSQLLQRVDPSQMGGLLYQDLRNRHTASFRGAVEGEGEAEAAALQEALRRVNATDVAVSLLDKTVIEAAEESIGKEFSDQPAVAAQLNNTLGMTAYQYSLYDRAERLFREALRYLEGPADDLRLKRINVHNNLTQLYAFMERYDDADAELAIAKEIAEGLDPDADELLDLRSAEALVLRERQAWPEAVAAYEGLVEERTMRQGREHPGTLRDMDGLGWSLMMQVRHEEAETLQVELLELSRRVRGPDHVDTLTAINNLAVTYVQQGKLEQAEPLYLEELAGSRERLGSDHRETHVSITNVGRFYIRQEDWTSAMPLVQESVDLGQRVLPPDSYGLGIGWHSMGEVLLGLSRPEEAEAALLKAWAIFDKLFGPGHPGRGRVAGDLVRAYTALGQTDKAAEWQSRVEEALEASADS